MSTRHNFMSTTAFLREFIFQGRRKHPDVFLRIDEFCSQFRQPRCISLNREFFSHKSSYLEYFLLNRWLLQKGTTLKMTSCARKVSVEAKVLWLGWNFINSVEFVLIPKYSRWIFKRCLSRQKPSFFQKMLL